MEPFKLPFPSLQFLAAHAVGRCLLLMKVDEAYWFKSFKGSLSECELRVDKLPLPPPPREYVRNVLRGFFEQVRGWVIYNCRNPGDDILMDARGNVDERRMIRHHFERRYKYEFYREDIQRFVHLLEHLSWHYPYICSNNFVSIIANLQKVYTSLEGPEYRIVDGKLQVVFRFVNPYRVPSAFNALLEWKRDPLTISMEQKDVLVTSILYYGDYNDDMFRIHLDLLQPWQRLEFVKLVVYGKMMIGRIQQVIRFLNFLDPETRQNCLLGLNKDDYPFRADRFLQRCLILGYESLFIPMLKLVEQNLDSWMYFELFTNLVNKVVLIGFNSVLLQFWDHLLASKKSQFHSVLENHNIPWHKDVKRAMKKLSETNTKLFQVVFDDVSASLSKEQAGLLLTVISNE